MAEGERVSIFTPSSTPPVNPSPAQPVVRQAPRVPSATSIEGVQSNPVQAPWQERWDADQRQLDRENPWRDTRGTVISKNADGSLTSRPRNGNGQQPSAPDAAQPGQPQAQPQTEVGPATVDGGKLKFGSFELSETDVAGIMERASLEQSRKATTPETADKYELSLPEGFELPAGTEWSWAVDDPVTGPMLGMAKQWAHSVGLDQAQFSKMLGMYAGLQLNDQRRFNEAKVAEVAKLGANAPARIDAVNAFLRAAIGDRPAEALRRSMFTADQIGAYEKLMSKFISGGVTGSPGAARDGGYAERGPPRLSEAEYSKLTYAQKTQYAQQFDQTKIQNGGG